MSHEQVGGEVLFHRMRHAEKEQSDLACAQRVIDTGLDIDKRIADTINVRAGGHE